MRRERQNNHKSDRNPRKGNAIKRGRNSSTSKEKEVKVEPIDKDNDPKWYMNNLPLLRDTTMIPFSQPVGKALNTSAVVDLRHEGGTLYTTALTAPDVQPGVFAMSVLPTFGWSDSTTSTINIAANKLYAQIRSNRSGKLDYDPSDVMMYIFAMDQCYSFHQWMRRVYGYMNTYSTVNMYLPRAFARNDWVDFDDLKTRMSDFRYYINNFALRLSTYLVPQVFNLFARHAFMYSNIYMDAPVAKSQFYQFVPEGFYKFEETALASGTSLSLKRMQHRTTQKLMTFDDIYNFGEDLFNAISYSEDANTISGDILKTFAAASVWKPAVTDPDYSTIPVYSAEVLGQIHNADFSGSLKFATETSDLLIPIYQDTDKGIIISKIYSKGHLNRTMVLDCFSDDPTPAEIMVNTRLKITNDPSIFVTIDGKVYQKVIAGSEIITQAWILSFNNAGSWSFLDIPETNKILYKTTNNVGNLASLGGRLEKFANHPLVQFYVADAADAAGVTSASQLVHHIYGDLNNSAAMSQVNLDDLHSVAMLSLLGI